MNSIFLFNWNRGSVNFSSINFVDSWWLTTAQLRWQSVHLRDKPDTAFIAAIKSIFFIYTRCEIVFYFHHKKREVLFLKLLLNRYYNLLFSYEIYRLLFTYIENEFILTNTVQKIKTGFIPYSLANDIK